MPESISLRISFVNEIVWHASRIRLPMRLRGHVFDVSRSGRALGFRTTALNYDKNRVNGSQMPLACNNNLPVNFPLLEAKEILAIHL